MDLHDILWQLNTKPHCLLSDYGSALRDRIQMYLQGEMVIEDMPMTETPMTGSEVMIIPISGVIAKRVGLPQEILSLLQIVDLDFVDQHLREAISNPEVKSVVLDVDSPGGFTQGLKSTGQLIDTLAASKDTVVWSDLLNASAAYEISSHVPIIGSIDAEFGAVGVFTVFDDTTQMYADAGIKRKLFKGGTYKAMGVDGVSLTPEQETYIQADINKTWEEFKKTVNIKRNIAEENMQGQTFTGIDAYNKGFIDGIATSIYEVIAKLSA